MIVVWGSRWSYSTLERGEFYCPSCLDAEAQYERKQGREWFTLYFIPIFPIGSRQEVVECKACETTYQPSVLELETPSEEELRFRRMALELQHKLEKGTSLEEAETELADDGMDRDEAVAFVNAVTEGEVRQCPDCGDHFVLAVKKCPRCRVKVK